MAHGSGADIGTLAAPGTLSAILKEFYIGPIQEQLNNEVMVLELMSKTTVDWNGRVAIIPVHLDRNAGVGYRAEGGVLPPAGHQTFNRLQIVSSYLYGRFQVTGPAMASAGKGGPNSFIGWMDAEMKKLVTDVKNEADRSMVSGGRVVGFINEHEDKAANPRTYEFFGDLERIEELRNIVGGFAVDLRLEVIRMDTYAVVPMTGGNLFMTCNATDLPTRTFTLDNIAANNLDLTLVGANAIPNGVALAIRVSTTQGNVNATAACDVLDEQPNGIFGNIADPTHFTVARTTATNTAVALQSTAVTMATAAGNHDRADIGLTRIQSVMDEVLNLSGSEPNIILMNPLHRQKYAALFQLTAAAANPGPNAVQNVSGEKAGQFTGGFSGLSYGSMPLKTSRHVANGGMIFLKTDTWKLLELQPHGFADVDGDVLLRVANQDSYEGYYRWYYNTVCVQPNRNAVLAGLTLL